MGMTKAQARKQFADLVQRLERKARLNPKGYKFQVTLLALLGYIYLLLLLLLAMALLGAIIFGIVLLINNPEGIYVLIKTAQLLLIIIVPVLIFVLTLSFSLLGILWRLIWFRIDPPNGLELHRGMAPRLFQLINRLQTTLNTQPLHTVLISDDFTAGVIQVPRLGLLGWFKNYLVIGLPMLQALSPDQFRAVLSHELGHISGNHSRFTVWVHSVWLTWVQLLESFENDSDEGHRGAGLIITFFEWYAPLFAAHEFALRRADEYEADRSAKRIAGPQAAGEALVNSAVKGIFLEEVFWPRLREQLDSHPKEQVAVMSTMCHWLAKDLPADPVNQCLRALLSAETNFDDTHPCLAERLSLLGFSPDNPAGDPARGINPIPLPTPPAETAAQYYLGNTAEKAVQFLDRAYVELIAMAQQKSLT